MSQRIVDHVFIVCVMAALGLFIGSTMAGLFGGLPLMVIAGVLSHRHMDMFLK